MSRVRFSIPLGFVGDIGTVRTNIKNYLSGRYTCNPFLLDTTGVVDERRHAPRWRGLRPTCHAVLHQNGEQEDWDQYRWRQQGNSETPTRGVCHGVIGIGPSRNDGPDRPYTIFLLNWTPLCDGALKCQRICFVPGQVERVKRVLSSQHEARVEIESLVDGYDFSETLTRARFEEVSYRTYRCGNGNNSEIFGLWSFCPQYLTRPVSTIEIDRVGALESKTPGQSTRGMHTGCPFKDQTACFKFYISFSC